MRLRARVQRQESARTHGKSHVTFLEAEGTEQRCTLIRNLKNFEFFFFLEIFRFVDFFTTQPMGISAPKMLASMEPQSPAESLTWGSRDRGMLSIVRTRSSHCRV